MRNRTGELMSRATNDLNAVRMVLGPGIMYSGTTIVTMVLAIALKLSGLRFQPVPLVLDFLSLGRQPIATRLELPALRLEALAIRPKLFAERVGFGHQCDTARGKLFSVVPELLLLLAEPVGFALELLGCLLSRRVLRLLPLAPARRGGIFRSFRRLVGPSLRLPRT